MNEFILNNAWLVYLIFFVGFCALLAWLNQVRFYDKINAVKAGEHAVYARHKTGMAKQQHKELSVQHRELSLKYNKSWHRILTLKIAWISTFIIFFLFTLTFWQFLKIQLFTSVLIWNVFDLLYNLFTGQKITYRGVVADTDTLFGLRIPDWLFFIGKIILLIFTIIIL